MCLVPALSVVLVFCATNCDASTSDTSPRNKKLLTDEQEPFGNEMTQFEISGRSSKDFINKTEHVKISEQEMMPNFLSSNFHDFISSDSDLNYSSEKSPNFPSKQNFYTLFSPRSYHAPKDKLPIMGFITTSQKPPSAHQYPKLQDRLPPFQLLKFKNANERTQRDLKADNQSLKNMTTRLARFVNIKRQGDDHNWNWAYQDDSNDDRMTPFEMMSMMVDRMDPPSRDNGDMASLLKSHLPVMVAAGIIPLSMILFAVLPILVKNYLPIKVGNPPATATTTVTGSRKNINNSTQFLVPILEAIGTFTPRSEESDCTLKAFCEMAKSEKSTWPVQETIQHVTSFVDDSILNSLGLGSLMKALSDGDCEKLVCSQSKIPTNTFDTHDKS